MAIYQALFGLKFTWARACWKVKNSLPPALLLLLHQVCKSDVRLVNGATSPPATSIRVTVRGGHGWPGALREVSLSARNLGFKLFGNTMRTNIYNQKFRGPSGARLPR